MAAYLKRLRMFWCLLEDSPKAFQTYVTDFCQTGQRMGIGEKLCSAVKSGCREAGSNMIHNVL